MTRINCIEPRYLSHRHLMAEYRELPRVFGLVKKAIARSELPEDPRNPTSYRLKTGHVRFFYCRLLYCFKRQQAIIAECQRRGWKVQHTNIQELLSGISDIWIRDWSPTNKDRKLNYDRIMERGGFYANMSESDKKDLELSIK